MVAGGRDVDDFRRGESRSAAILCLRGLLSQVALTAKYLQPLALIVLCGLPIDLSAQIRGGLGPNLCYRPKSLANSPETM
jgi:hypothetical protein